MQATRIQFTTDNGVTHLRARLETSDSEGPLAGHSFRLDIADIESEEANVPLLVAALDNLHVILGRYYTHRHIKQEIIELDRANEDRPIPDYEATRGVLVAERDAADSDLRRDVIEVSR